MAWERGSPIIGSEELVNRSHGMSNHGIDCLSREGNDGIARSFITYNELRRQVCQLSNGLKGLGIKSGDRIALYMSVSIDLVVAMLSCARIGAIHVVVVSSVRT